MENRRSGAIQCWKQLACKENRINLLILDFFGDLLLITVAGGGRMSYVLLVVYVCVCESYSCLLYTSPSPRD